MLDNYLESGYQKKRNASLEKLNKGFPKETKDEFGLTENDHIGGTFHKYNHIERNISNAMVYRQIQT